MSYTIRVNCTCGKVLKIPEKYAGKAGRCPNCGKKISIPALEDIKEKLAKKEAEEVKSCPTCGSYLNPGDLICVSCHTNLQTGEWETNNSSSYKEQQKSQKRLQYAGAAVFVVLIIIMGSLMFPKAENNVVHMSTKNNQNNTETTTQQQKEPLQKLKDMPEATSQDLEKKLKTFEEFLASHTEKDLINIYNSVRQKRYEMEAEEAHQKIPENVSLYKRWKLLENLSQRYHDTIYASKEIKKEQQVVVKQIEEDVQKYRKNIQDFLAAEENDRAIVAALSLLSQIAQENAISSKFEEEVTQSEKLAKQNLSKLLKAKSAPEEKEVGDQNLFAFQQDFNELLSVYRDYQEQWKFAELQKLMKPLLERFVPLQEKYSDNSDLQRFQKMYQENELMVSLWNSAEDGVLSQKDNTKILFLKNGGVEHGVITNYNEGEIYIKTHKEGESRVIKLRDLRVNRFVEFALMKRQNSPSMHRAAAIFYYLNNEPQKAKSAADKAIELREPKENLQAIYSWAEESITARQDQIDKIQTQQEKIDAQQEAESEARDLEVKLGQAWILVRQIIRDYKAGQNIKVLQGLQKLQASIPRDEVSKISDQVADQEGDSLADMANTARTHCEYCRHVGTLKCPAKDCQDGWFTRKRRLNDEVIETRERCDTCRGHGSVDCRFCVTRRKKRSFILLDTWYDDL